MSAIESELPAAATRIESLTEQLDQRELEHLSLRRLEAIQQDWEREREQLVRWTEQLNGRAAELQGATDRIREVVGIWDQVRESVADDEAAEAVAERIAATSALLTEAGTEIRDHLQQLIALQDQVLSQAEIVRQAVGRLETAEDQARGALIAPEQPPLWKVFGAEADYESLGGQVTEALALQRHELEVFVEDSAPRVAIHIVIFVMLSGLMLRLRHASRKMVADQPDLEHLARILARPLSAALLVTLLLSKWVYVRPPQVVVEIILFLALIPLMLLLPGLIQRRMHGPLYGLNGLFVIDRIESLFGAGTLLQRLTVLGMTLLALFGLYVMLRPGGPFSSREGSLLWRVSRIAAYVATITLLLALLANVVGSVALANLFVEAVFLSAYIAVVFFAGFIVLDALFEVALHVVAARQVRFARTYTSVIRRRSRFVLRVLLVIWWCWIVLGVFQIREPVTGLLAAIVDAQWPIGAVKLSVGSIIAFFVTLWASVLLSRFIRVVLEHDVLPRVTLPRGVGSTITMMVRYGVVTLGVILAAAAAGFELSQFAFVAGALGVGIGFGLQNVVNNFVSGLILAFERPIQVGDTVETGALIGTVRNIGIRSSVLRTFDGAEVIVPNGNLISAEVTNWTLSDRRRRMTVSVGVAYGTDPNRVIELLLEATDGHDLVDKTPKPYALFLGFGDSSLDFEVRFWTSQYDDWLEIKSQVTIAVNDLLAAADIEIPFPQRDLNFRTMDEPFERGLHREGGGDSPRPRQNAE
jgi:small-conductance mechanosensitive channel